MGTRGYSRFDIEEAIRESQERRHDARVSDDSWRLVQDDMTPLLGMVWRRVEEE